MSAWPSDASRYDAGQFHPEFGYFAPTVRFRSKAWLALKAVVLGALAGAVAMFFLTVEREGQALTMLATPVVVAPSPPKPAQIAAQTAMPTRTAQTQPAGTYSWVPVRFLPESMAVPAAAHGVTLPQPAAPETPEAVPPLRSTVATAPAPEPASTVGASPAASEAAVSPPATAVATSAPTVEPVAKAVAKPKKKVVREPPPEPEPRHAYASPPRPFVLPIFGFGWQR
jgi:hypothetical protein